MSDLSEQLAAVFNEGFPDPNTEEEMKTFIHSVINGGKVPGQDEFTQYAQSQVVTLLRGARYHFAGAAPWPTGEAAIEATANFLNDELLACQTRFLSMGILVGNRYPDHDNYPQLFAGSDYRFAVGVQALRIAVDKEAMDEMSKHLAHVMVSATEVVGFRASTGKETAHVWDIWYAATGRNSLAMYEAGCKLGQQWHEKEVLEGILRATQSEVSE